MAHARAILHRADTTSSYFYWAVIPSQTHRYPQIRKQLKKHPSTIVGSLAGSLAGSLTNLLASSLASSLTCS